MVNETISDIGFDAESNNETECTNNPLSAHKHAANKFLVISNENLLDLAPSKYRETKHNLLDEKCEEVTFPKIFFKGKFVHNFPREHYLTPTNISMDVF